MAKKEDWLTVLIIPIVIGVVTWVVAELVVKKFTEPQYEEPPNLF